MLNGLFRDENTLTFGQELLKTGATVSKKMQEIALSAGVPKTNINFFTIGQGSRKLTSGNVKAISALVRSNFNSASIRFFTQKSGHAGANGEPGHRPRPAHRHLRQYLP